MILTVTLNTALDVTYHVPRLLPHASHRVSDVRERPGGKGVNVARVLAALGHRVTVTGFAGGPAGELLRGSLDGVHDALVPCAGNTRRTVAVVDATTGDTTQFNEAGPVISAAEWAGFQDRYRDLLGTARAVALCGSLPPGLPVGAYAVLVRAARAAGVPVLLDTGGEALRRGVAARPDLIKPNATELAELTGSREPLPAALAARRRGAHAVVASLGPAGLLAATPEGTWQAAPPQALAGNPTGAGDSAVAGLLSALAEGLDWPERLSRAVALSAATVRAPAAGEFDSADYAGLLPAVRIAAI
ncbi:1-phosphofructokinase [Streptomyces venezuelae]|uniref:1-phosphofructokinase n=1 Tax=Streptomyces venezuelae TaxID=54571 RepID=A0A5P2D182_STRVZ|nr:1-phosphofructokinase family hexose kinase [Streptomyces venezuelae]QES48902.1 1-phosphofructokinase [Streptomyces venezuelae]